jgi:hypothetical protein
MPAAGIGPFAEHLERYLKGFRSFKVAGKVKIDEDFLCRKFGSNGRPKSKRWLRETIWRLCEAGRFTRGKEKDWGKEVDVLYASGDGGEIQQSRNDPSAESATNEERSFLDRGTILPPARNDPSSSSAAPIQAVFLGDNKTENNNNDVAAAEEKTQETLNRLSSLGVKPEAIRSYVEKDPVQAQVVISLLRGRRRPPDYPTGFAVKAFEERWTGPDPPASEPFNRAAFNAKLLREREAREKREQELRSKPWEDLKHE